MSLRRIAFTAALLAMHAVQGCGGDTREGGSDTVASSMDSVTADSLTPTIRWGTRVLQNTDRRFRPAGWSDDSTLWGLVRDSITRVDVNTGEARTVSARGWALQAAPGVVSWHNEDGAWMMAGMSAPNLLPLHNGIAPTHVLWSRDGRRAILAWEDEGRAHQEIFHIAGNSRALDVQIQGYYGDRAVLWLDSTRVVLEIVASSGKNGATGYKESGWRGDLAILDVQSGKYQRVTDADDGQYLRVAGPNGQGILVTQWGAGRIDEHWLYDVDRWTRTSTSVPRGRAVSSRLGAVVVLVDADADSTSALLLESVDAANSDASSDANSDSTRAIQLGRIGRDAQPQFSPSGAIGSVHTAAGTVLIVRDDARSALESPSARGVTTTAQGVAITFVANAGVMLSAGSSKVLIDALYREYDGYPVAADSTRAAIEQGRAPFDGVNLILVTHRHGDHFHPGSVASHMLSNPRAVLFTSRQVVDSLRRGAITSAFDQARIIARTTPPHTRSVQVVNGTVVELIGLAHGGSRHRVVEHLAYIVEIGGRRVLHTGDADLSEQTLRSFGLDTSRIDIALVPSWFIADAAGRQAVQRWIKPRQIVAIHLPVNGEREARKLSAQMPGVMSFWRSLDVRTW